MAATRHSIDSWRLAASLVLGGKVNSPSHNSWLITYPSLAGQDMFCLMGESSKN